MPKDQDAAVVVETSPDGRYHRYKEKLGEGSFKSVYKAFDSEMGIEVAWNQVKIKGRLIGDAKERFMEEVILLKKLEHKSIIVCWNYWEDEEQEHVNFITELMTSGTLKSFVKTKKVNLRIIRKWARQILSALEYLHTKLDKPVIHRDLKCDNIFINGNLGEVKLGDLGLSTMLTETHAQSVIGTPEFMAPELYEEQYTEKVDIYAFGMCILEIFTNEYPYSECSNAAQIYKKVTKGLPPSSLDKMENIAVKHFIEQCLMSEADRPSATTLLQHDLLMEEDLVGPGPVLVPKEGAPDAKQEPSQPSVQGEVVGQARPAEEGKGMGPEILGAEMRAVDADDAGPETGTISIQAKIKGKNKMIEFDFDTEKDSVTEVAMDLLEQIEADKCALPHFEEVIAKAVDNFMKEQSLDVPQSQNENVRPNSHAEPPAVDPVNPVPPSQSPSADGHQGGVTPSVSPPPSSGLQQGDVEGLKGASQTRVNPSAPRTVNDAAGGGGGLRKDSATGQPLAPPQQAHAPAARPQENDVGGAGAISNGATATAKPGEAAAGLGGRSAEEGRGGMAGGLSTLGEAAEGGPGLQGHAGVEVQSGSAQQRASADGGSAGKEELAAGGASGAGGELKSYSDAAAQPAAGSVGAGNPRPGASVGANAAEQPSEGGVRGAAGRGAGGSVAGNPTFSATSASAAGSSAVAGPAAAQPAQREGGGAGAAGSSGQGGSGGAAAKGVGELKTSRLSSIVVPWGEALKTGQLAVPEGSQREVDKKVKEAEQVYTKKVKEAQEQFLAAVREIAEAHGGKFTTNPAPAAAASSAAGAGSTAAGSTRQAGAEAAESRAPGKPASPVPMVPKAAVPQLAAASQLAAAPKPSSPVQAAREAPAATTRNPAGTAGQGAGGAREGDGA